MRSVTTCSKSVICLCEGLSAAPVASLMHNERIYKKSNKLKKGQHKHLLYKAWTISEVGNGLCVHHYFELEHRTSMKSVCIYTCRIKQIFDFSPSLKKHAPYLVMLLRAPPPPFVATYPLQSFTKTSRCNEAVTWTCRISVSLRK
jgi:hypothetical protein